MENSEGKVRLTHPCEDSRSDGSGTGSEHVEFTVAVAFGSLEAVAELEKLILQRARLGLVDRVAEVADQLLEVEAIDRNALDVVARCTGFESSLALREWLAVAKQQPAFRCGEVYPDRVARHGARSPGGISSESACRRSRPSQPAARHASRSP